ncbi:MAG TPA: 3-dehydroquinate synthase [Flavisolibacter sp.]|jgi:3-dehydroquinate synthase|nr:3-dehydroquinate synthase [Flavisolibacter sp.]
MHKKVFRFSNSSVDYYFEGRISQIKEVVGSAKTIFVTDENVFAAHEKQFKNKSTIVLKAGEEHKNQSTVDSVIKQLIEMEADRKTVLVGVGGGVVTDITGYVASIYMRGIPFGFIPTSLLAMVDASIGGKNGIDVGVYKNMVGIIRQPSFLLFDPLLLQTLPDSEWRNGFAEIIKHASIRDSAMFKQLQQNDLGFYQKKKKDLHTLIQRNALLKTKVVQQDEFEKGDRKLLNFGHTLGHALENQYDFSHGQAISIGMAYASKLSQKFSGFKNVEKVVDLLTQYGLPTFTEFDKDKVINVLKMDKKKSKDSINFILLEKIGKAFIKEISIKELYENL